MIVTIKKKLEETLIPEHLRAAGIIPVLAYDEDDHVFLMDDHSAGFGFMCEPLCGADEKVQERMNGFLNQEFPSKTTLQFVLFRSPDINQEMYRMMGLRDGFRHELLTSVIKERINFLQHHTTDRIFAKTNKGIYDNGLIQDLKLFVTCKVPIKNNNPTESELQQLAQLRTKVESSLQTVGLRPRTMTAVNYIRIMSTILNWGPDASWRHDSVDWEMDKPICEQIFDYGTDVEVSKNGIRLGDYHAKVMSAKKLPDVFYFGDALTYAGDLSGGNTNKNLVIAAESGSGKSFLTNELIFSYLSEGAQVWVIDAGKSYQKLSEMLNGDFVHFEEGTHVCLNPFELIQNYEDEEDAIVSLVCAMASAKGLLDEWQISALKQVLSRLWEEKGKEMKVDDIAERCLEEENDQRLKDIGQQLYAFTSQGSYGKYFSRKNNVSFQNQFTVLELDELQGRKHLRQVVLLQLIYQIQQEVFLGERNRKKVVIVDEAWDLLKEGEVSVFMEHAYRKFRKYGGSVVIATQSINDLYENAVGRAIAENSASMYLLGQTEETVESVKRSGRLTLSEGGFHTLKTVHTIQGVYSEIFIKSKSGMGVGRLIVGDFQKLLYSTDPVDVNAIDQFVKQGMSIPEAIKAVMRSRRQAA
ncbi:TraC family protein [Escherichia coli]